MEFSRKDIHDIKNQISITIGLNEIVIKKLKKADLQDLPGLIDRLERSHAAAQSVIEFIEEKKKSDPEYLNE